MPRLYIYGAVGLAMLLLFGWLQITRANLKTAKLERDVAIEQRDTMFAINKEILETQEKDAILRIQLYEDYKGARADAEEFEQKVSEHDLSSLAKGKPGLITTYARRATDRVLRDIETAANQDQAVSEPAADGSDKAEAPPTNSSGD